MTYNISATVPFFFFFLLVRHPVFPETYPVYPRKTEVLHPFSSKGLPSLSSEVLQFPSIN